MPDDLERSPMCFSATASFTASAILSGAGIMSIALVKRPEQRLFATIPLLFAVQQFIEGWLWIGLSDPARATLLEPLTRTFLFFSQVVWPVWVPGSLLRMEQEKRHRVMLSVALAAGLLVSAYFSWHLLSALPLASISGHHIRYAFDTPMAYDLLIAALYGTATVLSSFFSSLRRMWMLGAALIISYAVTRVVFPGSIISVWCYFAALISAVIIQLVRGPRTMPDLLPTAQDGR